MLGAMVIGAIDWSNVAASAGLSLAALTLIYGDGMFPKRPETPLPPKHYLACLWAYFSCAAMLAAGVGYLKTHFLERLNAMLGVPVGGGLDVLLGVAMVAWIFCIRWNDPTP